MILNHCSLNLFMSFSLPKIFSYKYLMRQIMHIIFSLFSPLGFKGVLMTYTHILVSPQDFPIGFLEEFYKIIFRDD
jgi:hypothetical protein